MVGHWAAVGVRWLLFLPAALIFAYTIAVGSWAGVGLVAAGCAAVYVGATRPLLLAMVWIVGTPTVFLVTDRALTTIPIVTTGRALFAILVGFLAMRLLSKPSSFQRPGPMERAMAVYLIVIAVSWAMTLTGKNFEVVRQDIYLLVEGFVMPFVAFVVARNVDWSPELIKRVMWALVAVGVFEIVIGLYEYATGVNFFFAKRLELAHVDRVTGSFSNALAYGMVLGITFFCSLFLYLHTKSRPIRIVLAVMAFGFLLCLLLSEGRAVWLSVPIGLVLVYARCRAIRPLLGGALAIAVVAALVVVPYAVDFQALDERLNEMGSVYNRIALNATSLSMIAAKPWLGFGFGINTFQMNKAAYYSSWGDVSAQWASYPTVPHNEFLMVTVMMGVVGLLAYGALLWASWGLLSRTSREARSTDPLRADLALFVQASLLVLLINALFMDVMLVPYVLMMMFFLMGIVARQPEALSVPVARQHVLTA